jgi:hypothetical protein
MNESSRKPKFSPFSIRQQRNQQTRENSSFEYPGVTVSYYCTLHTMVRSDI